MQYYKLIETILLYIEDNLSEPLNLSAIADGFNISKYYFHRLFSAVMGMSLNDYLLSRRLNAAIDRIQSTTSSLTEIAYACGFSSQAAFNRCFKGAFGFSPTTLRKGHQRLAVTPIPELVQRPIKNLNGDMVTDFTLEYFQPLQIKGIVFEIDFAEEGFRNQIRNYAKIVLDYAKAPQGMPCYMVYSNCQPDSTKFKAIFGLPMIYDCDLPNVFTVDLPELFCAKFKYKGDLLEISELFKTDFLRFIRVTKYEAANHSIELIQVYDTTEDYLDDYWIHIPIQPLPLDLED